MCAAPTGKNPHKSVSVDADYASAAAPASTKGEKKGDMQAREVEVGKKGKYNKGKVSKFIGKVFRRGRAHSEGTQRPGDYASGGVEGPITRYPITHQTDNAEAALRRDYEQLEVLVQGRDDGEVVKKAFLEVRRHQMGQLPEWAEAKRANPKANISLLRFQHENRHGTAPASSIVMVSPRESSGQSCSRAHTEPEQGFFQRAAPNYLDDSNIIQIFDHYSGQVSEALGISHEKGGVQAIVDILIDGTIYATFHGPLTNGQRSETAGKHGPSFVIFADPTKLERSGTLSEVKVEDLECILVQSEEHKLSVMDALDKATEFLFISPQRCQMLKDLVKTYEEHVQSLCS